MMTVAFMASDAIALDSISFLRSSRECRLACIVSNPDRPKGRGKKMQPNAVSAWALENEVELLNDDDYVTRYARENYVFTKDGEQVVILPDIDQEK